MDAYEEAELDRSIRHSIILEQSNPFSRDAIPGAFPPSQPSPGESSSPLLSTVGSTTVLAGLIERILARLEFTVKNARIRIRHDDGKHGGIFELRISGIRYADQSDEGDHGSKEQTVRAIALSSVAIYLLPLPTPPFPAPTRGFTSVTRSSSISSTSSTSSSYGSKNVDMYMSQAVADLRQSRMSAVGSEASIYQSALSERISEEQDEPLPPPSRDKRRDRSVTPKLSALKTPEEALLLSFGTEDISFSVMTTPPSIPAGPSGALPAGTGHKSDQSATRPQPLRSSTSFIASQVPALGFDLSIGTISILLLPSQAASVLSVIQAAVQSGYSGTSEAAVPATPVFYHSPQPRVEARMRLKAVHMAFIYDILASNELSYTDAVSEYWSKPATLSVPFGHLKLRLEGLEGIYSSRGNLPHPVFHPSQRGMRPNAPRRTTSHTHSGPRPPSLNINLTDATVFEYLASTSSETMDHEDTPPGGLFPVVIFDTNLPRQYDVAPAAQLVPSNVKASFPRPHSIFPEYESVDWRNTGTSRRSGGADKAWKVRQKGRGALKGTSSTSSEDEGPVMLARKELYNNSGERDFALSGRSLINIGATVNLRPLHLFFDLSLVERLLPMLRILAPVIKTTSPDREFVAPALRDLRIAKLPLSDDCNPRFVIDDLDAQASSLSTIQAAPTSSEAISIHCPVLRLDIRCPAPLNRRGSWGDGAHLRSGIVTLDIHRLIVNTGQSRSYPYPSAGDMRPRQGASVSSDSIQSGNASCEWQKLILFFCRVPGKTTTYILPGVLIFCREEVFRVRTGRPPCVGAE